MVSLVRYQKNNNKFGDDDDAAIARGLSFDISFERMYILPFMTHLTL